MQQRAIAASVTGISQRRSRATTARRSQVARQPTETPMRKAKPKPPSAIDLLKQDHAYVKQAYRNFDKMDQEAVIDEDDLMEEAEIEHESAKALIRRLKRMKPSDPAYVPTFTVLCEYLLHHVKEEASEMFPKVQRSKLNLRTLGKKVMERKLKLLRRA
jgi:hypothetical protein